MKPKDFAELVQAFISILIVCVFLLLAVKDGTYKDALIAAFAGVIGYWLGSSQGSKVKTDLLQETKQ